MKELKEYIVPLVVTRRIEVLVQAYDKKDARARCEDMDWDEELGSGETSDLDIIGEPKENV